MIEPSKEAQEAFLENNLLTTSQVAAVFQVTPWTVLNWSKKGTLNPIKLPSGQYRYRRADVLKILEEADHGS